MNNYKELFFKIKKSNLEEFTIERNFSKKAKDEFLILRLSKPNNNYDIQIQIWKKLFSNCKIFQISGHHNNNYFKIFFQIHNNHIQLFNFANKSSCRDLYDNKHKFFEHTPENEQSRKKIYRDTKKLTKKFQNLISKF